MDYEAARLELDLLALRCGFSASVGGLLNEADDATDADKAQSLPVGVAVTDCHGPVPDAAHRVT
jgi:hypothetical protein